MSLDADGSALCRDFRHSFIVDPQGETHSVRMAGLSIMYSKRRFVSGETKAGVDSALLSWVQLSSR